MIKDITIGQYIPGESFVHKLDARVKILFSLLFIIDLFLIKEFSGYIVIFIFTMMAIIVSKIQFRYIYKGLKPIFILMIITALFNVFLTRGNVLLWQWGFVKIYKEGIVTAIFMILRLTFLIIGTS
ncbi:MAG TPA: transporter, partial [Clostridium sp.]|nr:transporter [Clostridium sp.]